MEEISIFEVAPAASGVLPIDFSDMQLQSFNVTSELSNKQSDNVEQNFMSKISFSENKANDPLDSNASTDLNSKPKHQNDKDLTRHNKSDQISTMSDSGYWDIGGLNGDGSDFEFDAFGSNLPEYGLDSVVVIAGKKLPKYWNFPIFEVQQPQVNIFELGATTPGTSPEDPCTKVSQQVDWQFIKSKEGNVNTGYVPTTNGSALGHSGVTIAAGFDIGQHSSSDLSSLGLSTSLISKLSPYLQKTGTDAVNALAATPLSISAAEAEAINSAAHSQTLINVMLKYDNAVGTLGSFYHLPAEAQTVIASVAFQYGDLAVKTPIFWNQIVAKDWTGAIANLNNFHDLYPTRRQAEAALLKSAMDAGKLHNSSTC